MTEYLECAKQAASLKYADNIALLASNQEDLQPVVLIKPKQ